MQIIKLLSGSQHIYNDALSALGNRHTQAALYAIGEIEKSPLSQYAEEIVMFGSCARGEARYDSDVDFLLVLGEDADTEKLHPEIIRLRGNVVPPDAELPEVDLKLTRGDAWKTSDNIFYFNVQREGKTVWHR